MYRTAAAGFLDCRSSVDLRLRTGLFGHITYAAFPTLLMRRCCRLEAEAQPDDDPSLNKLTILPIAITLTVSAAIYRRPGSGATPWQRYSADSWRAAEDAMGTPSECRASLVRHI
jgi:hypothetical protein